MKIKKKVKDFPSERNECSKKELNKNTDEKAHTQIYTL